MAKDLGKEKQFIHHAYNSFITLMVVLDDLFETGEAPFLVGDKSTKQKASLARVIE